MSDRDRLWERVDAALDERRDPLEDAHVQLAVAQRPELADELLRLRSRLEELRGRPRRRRRVVAAVGALAACLVAVVALRSGRGEVVSPPAVAQATTASAPASARVAPRSSVLAFEAVAVVEDSRSRTTTTFDGLRTTTQREVFDDPARSSTPAFVAVVSSFSAGH